MAQSLPLVPSVPIYRVGTTLGGRQFIFDVKWNARDEAWYMDISTSSDVIIRHGIKIVLGTIFDGRTVNSESPQGALIATDLTGVGLDAGFDDLGDRVVVYFLTPDDV
jgi:hypothetical protein